LRARQSDEFLGVLLLAADEEHRVAWSNPKRIADGLEVTPK